MTKAESLAANFAAVIREWLTPHELAIVRRQNRGAGGVCHTHDYCDANEAMALAFRQTFGRDPDLYSYGDNALWNEAWNRAKARGFAAPPRR